MLRAVASIVLVSVSSASAQECFAWLERSVEQAPNGPQSAVWDSAHDRAVVLNGDPRTWFWNEAWTFVEGAQPVPYEQLAFDSDRGVVVAFGAGSTWELSGDVWTSSAALGPGNRTNFGLAYDPSRQATILYGGDSGGLKLTDTWAWNGSSWALVATNGPWMEAPGLAFDEARSVLVLHGRRVSGSSSSWTWEWESGAWVKRVEANDDYARSMFYSPAAQQVVMMSNQMRGWNGTAWSSLPWPASAGSFDSTATANEDAILVFFQGSGAVEKRTPTASSVDYAEGPVAHDPFGVVFDPVRGRTWVAGAPNTPKVMWGWDGDGWQSVATPFLWPGIGTNDESSIGRYPGREEICVTSGLDPLMYTWNGEAWAIHPAPPNFTRALSHHESRGTMFAYSTTSNAAGLWEWDGVSWLYAGIAPSGARRLVYDSARDVLVTQSNGVLWEWDGLAWSTASLAAPDIDRAFAYDATVGGVVFVDVQAGTTSLWDGASWSVLESDLHPPAGGEPSLGYDAARGVTVAFNRYWFEGSAGPNITRQPVDASSPVGGEAEFSIEAAPLGGMVFQWRKDGLAIHDGGKFGGTTSGALTVFDTQVSDEGVYDVVVLNSCAMAAVSNPAALSVLDGSPYDTDFEAPTYTGATIGVKLDGQGPWYNPIPSGGKAKVYKYANNSLGVAKHPENSLQFAAGRREGEGKSARAAADVDLTSSERWTLSLDILGRYNGVGPAETDLGLFMLSPDTTARGFRGLMVWDGPSATSFSIEYRSATYGGTSQTLSPGASWEFLLPNRWFRLTTTIDRGVNRIRRVSIEDLHTGERDSVWPLGWYLTGGALSSLADPTTIWLAATGGTGNAEGNIAAWDDVGLSPGSLCDADCEEDGDVDLFDVLCFQQAFSSGSGYADFEHDGDLDLFDFLAYQDEFVAGCP